jgi:hypothetical protein
MERWIASPLWPTYMGEKVRTLGKTYERLKKGAIGNTLRGTHCKHREHNGNSMGTHWEHVGNKGKSSLFQPKLKRKKNQGTLSGC